MLSKKLQRASVIELNNFLNRERKYSLTVKQVKEIQDLIVKKEKRNEEFANKLVDSKLYKLACVQLKRKGKALKCIFGTGQIRYEYEPIDVIEAMRKIVATAELKGFLQ